MRHKFASGLLITSVIVWGIWCGGQIFNELMTVPIWSASPPESLKIYSELPRKGGVPFFPLFNPLFVVLSVGATLAAWKSARRSRKWLALSAVIAAALFISLVFYLVPLVSSMLSHSVAGTLPASEIVSGVERWKLGNRIRIVVELFGFACSVIALRTWSAEAASPGEQAA
jgi:hypothetical protein